MTTRHKASAEAPTNTEERAILRVSKVKEAGKRNSMEFITVESAAFTASDHVHALTTRHAQLLEPKQHARV